MSSAQHNWLASTHEAPTIIGRRALATWICLFGLILPITGPLAAMVSFDPSSQIVEIGNQVSLDVGISGLVGVPGPGNLTTDEAVVEYHIGVSYDLSILANPMVTFVPLINDSEAAAMIGGRAALGFIMESSVFVPMLSVSLRLSISGLGSDVTRSALEPGGRIVQPRPRRYTAIRGISSASYSTLALMLS